MTELTQPRSSVTRPTISTAPSLVRAAGAFAAALLLAAASASAAPPSASHPGPLPHALARKVAGAYGGAPKLARVRAVRQSGAVTALQQGGRVGRLERVLALPDSLRVEIVYPGERELRVSHRGRGFRDGQDVTGTVPHFAMMLQAARIALPFWIAAGDARIRYAGTLERESRTLESVVAQLQDGLSLVAEIDPASGRIVRTLGRIPGPGGQSIEFVNTYSDFRSVGGVLFAHREENFARGVHTGDTTLQRVELLTNAPAGAFDLPDASPAGERL